MTQENLAAIGLTPRIVGETGDVIADALTFVREHLGMEVAYLSEFVGDDLVFRAVSAPGLEEMVSVGDTMPLSETYCRHIVDGKLPELMPDTTVIPFAKQVPVTEAIPIRAHVSVPIRRADGSVYGMFCTLSRQRQPSLNDRDLEVMRAFAAVTQEQVNTKIASEVARSTTRRAIEHVMETGAFQIALQPITALQNQCVKGFEALCRFAPEPYRAPNHWFDDATEVGLGMALELAVIEVALGLLPRLEPQFYMSLNASPATMASGKVVPLIAVADSARVVIEITEHTAVEDMDALLFELDRLRTSGARIAIDDAGVGYSGLHQILQLRPDLIKLDMSLTRNVDTDLARRSLAAAMVQFAKDTGAQVVAEGIETEAEMRALRQIGVELGQGYYLGRPLLAAQILTPAHTA